MKVITEAYLREELGRSQPEVYYVPEGKFLSPAAREFLMGRKIKISSEPEPIPEPTLLVSEAEVPPTLEGNCSVGAGQAQYVDYQTGACYFEKPVHMTKLYGNVLIAKDHPLIQFRGRLESLEASFVLLQTTVYETGSKEKLLDDLDDLLAVIREMVHCDRFNEELKRTVLLGLTMAEQQERLQEPARFYGVSQLARPDYTLGRIYNTLYQLYTVLRETESLAVAAFRDGSRYIRKDILKVLNRLSGAIQITMYKYLAGEYK